jgi:tartrate/fumarate subfamily iron-sulfur-dependent hydro-lyase beta chain
MLSAGFTKRFVVESKSMDGAIELKGPFNEAMVRELCAGQRVRLSGIAFTGRDRFHKHIASGGESPFDMADGVLYHCGPVVVYRGGRWLVRAAGPTTSMREEPYAAEVMRRLGVRIMIGKGGMGAATQAACLRYGCVYLQAVGGAASVMASAIEEVTDVAFLEEFGAAEALWKMRVEGLEAVVAMDTHGGNLYDEVRSNAFSRFKCLLG